MLARRLRRAARAVDVVDVAIVVATALILEGVWEINAAAARILMGVLLVAAALFFREG